MNRFALVMLAVVAGVLPSVPAAGDFAELVARLPRGGNVLVMIDAESVLASGLAQREGWQASFERDFSASPMLMPPGTLQFALAGRLDFATFSSEWEAAVVRMDEDIPMSAVARLERGVADNVAGIDAVASPKGIYIAKLGQGLYGVMKPGDRQRTARWLRDSAPEEGPRLSDYLTAAAAFPDNAGTEMILSIDLADAIGRVAIRDGLSRSPVVKAAGLDVDAATDDLLELEGLTLGIKVNDRASGALRVDFARAPKVLMPIAKDLLLEVLADAGAEVDEFYDWKVRPEKRGFRLSGRLDRSGLTRVFSFLELDTPDIAGAEAESPASRVQPTDSMSNEAEVSRQYFRRVNDYLEDLKRERGATSYYSIARWFEKYADRIDQLPLLNVDSEVVDYAIGAANTLRDCALSIRGSGIRTGARLAQPDGYWAYGAFPGRFPGAPPSPDAAGRAAAVRGTAIRAQERASSVLDVRGTLTQLRAESARVRRVMTDRYGIEF